MFSLKFDWLRRNIVTSVGDGNKLSNSEFARFDKKKILTFDSISCFTRLRLFISSQTAQALSYYKGKRILVQSGGNPVF